VWRLERSLVADGYTTQLNCRIKSTAESSVIFAIIENTLKEKLLITCNTFKNHRLRNVILLNGVQTTITEFPEMNYTFAPSSQEFILNLVFCIQ